MAAMDSEDSHASFLKVFMFPWLAYGHISPFLGLSKNLADRGFSIYLCSTPINLQSIKHKITQNYFQSIHLIEFPLESTPDFPPHFHTTNGLPTHLHPILRKSVHKAKPNLSKILGNLKPSLIIYDIHQSWIAGLSFKHNIPAIKFMTSGGGAFAYFFHMSLKPGIPFPFPEIYLTDLEDETARATVVAMKKDQDKEADDENDFVISERECDKIMLIKSSREIEGKYIDYVSELLGLKVYPFCSLLNGSFDKEDDGNHELINWLGTKQEGSSIYVSFGSELFLNKEEIEEIAIGLELSNVNFIWVLRFPKGDEIDDDSMDKAGQLPEGFLNRVGDKGKVVTGWAPQARILNHSSIGGFMSHCGWNSLMEAIEIGIPIIAVPMHLDQPFNARVMVGLGVGVEVKRDSYGKLKREEIASVIKDVVDGVAGEDARRKVRYIGEKLKDEENDVFDGLAEMLKIVVSNDNKCYDNNLNVTG